MPCAKYCFTMPKYSNLHIVFAQELCCFYPLPVHFLCKAKNLVGEQSELLGYRVMRLRNIRIRDLVLLENDKVLSRPYSVAVALIK